MPDINTKPAPEEYPEFFETYLKKLSDADLFALLENQAQTLIGKLQNLPESATEKGYAEGKWSLKELVQHLLDTERIMSYRALCFSRGETVSLPGFDEDTYVANSDANRRPLAELLAEYSLLRQNTLSLFKSFTPEMLLRSGTANGHVNTVKALAWIIAAHEKHHLQVIDTRYLEAEASASNSI